MENKLETPKIKIYTRSMNKALYNRSMFFINLPYPKICLLNTSANGYLYQMVNDMDADIIINIDEDAFVFDLQKLNQLIEYVIENDYINCGMPDGGVVHLRHFNPLVTNPYFNILNVREIRKTLNEFNEKDYNVHKEIYIDKSPKRLLKGAYEYVYYEPYYPFFIWMSQNFKTLYLNAETHVDGLTSILHDHENKPFLMHTWFSRMYNVDKQQTKRIIDVVHECELYSGKTYKAALTETISLFREYHFNYLKHSLKMILKRLK